MWFSGCDTVGGSGSVAVCSNNCQRAVIKECTVVPHTTQWTEVVYVDVGVKWN